MKRRIQLTENDIVRMVKRALHEVKLNESLDRRVKKSLHESLRRRRMNEEFYDMDDMGGYEEDYDDNYDDYQDHNFDEYQPDHYCSDCEDDDYNGMTFQTSNDGNHIRHRQSDGYSNWKDLEGDDDDPYFNDEYGNELHTNRFGSF